MRDLKKIAALVLVGSMCVAMVACGKTKDDNTTNENTTTAGGQQEVTTEAAGANGAEYRDDVPVADIEAAVAAALGEAYYANMPMDTLEGLEITPDMYEEFVYMVPMISANVDTLIVVKAADGKVSDVEAKLNAFRDRNINDLMQYPMNLAKIQCSQVLTFGEYVVFVQFGADKGMLAVEAAGDNVSEDEAAKLEMDAINEQNEIAINAIKEALTK